MRIEPSRRLEVIVEKPSGEDRALSRRKFLARMGIGLGAGAATIATNALGGFGFLEPLRIDNPLLAYPNRDWERVYRDLYAYDSTFTFTCAPNDTHNCILQAYVRSGVIVRVGPTFGYGAAKDLTGGRASHRWDPRCCQKGLALVRRFYGDRRCKYPLVRQGWLAWARAGFPRDTQTGAVDAKYLARGKDPFVRVGWEEAFELVAKSMHSTASAYSGDTGKKWLLAQKFDPLMVDTTQGAGVRTIKMRGGMPLLGLTRIFGQYRFANSLALLDHHVRKVGPDAALGSGGWDNYTWHTDLPPGHPMATGQQTMDFDLSLAEHAKVIVVWGMNWITTKMPDAHWLTEARMKGTKVVVIAAEYSATMNKADLGLVVRPGTTPALALGFANVILREKLYDAAYVKAYTDYPSLVRLDTLERLRAEDVAGISAPTGSAALAADVLAPGVMPPAPFRQSRSLAPKSLEAKLAAFTVWDSKRNQPVAVSRGEVGKRFVRKGVDPALEGRFQVTLKDGKTVECRPVFDLIREYVLENFDPKTTSEITWAPEEGIVEIARLIAKHPEKTLFACGMGPNQFFNNDLKDRAIFVLAALTRNIGFVGGTIGSYAGNYRGAYFNALPQYIAEDPFDLELDPKKPARVKPRFRFESVHYWNHGDKILHMGKEVLTGKTHLPTPTKYIWVNNSNSLIGNAKGHYETVMNTLHRVETVVVNEWWWTASCEYADVVFPVDSWAEFKHPDVTASVTNPFISVYPRTPIERIFRTKSDIECSAGVAAALGKLTKDDRFDKMWRFVHEGRVDVYLQRIFDGSSMARGIDVLAAEADAKRGVPTIIESRTYPKLVGWEQAYEDRPWYTRTGRVELYRDEKEFIESGENLPVHREPIDSTFYEPNVIVAKAHEALRPKTPKDFGVSESQLDGDTRQARHVVKAWRVLATTKHPLASHDPNFKFIFHTPKYRHGAHTTPVDTDIVAVWFGPFGDMMRHDRRTPFVTESYMDIHPEDARALGCQDGDYVHVDADPEDRPFIGWQKRPEDYKVARLLCRIRYYPGTPRGVLRMWHNMYGATYGSVRGHETHAQGLARNQETGYQALFRYGCHQSCTRGFIKPTMMTDSLVRKNMMTQMLGQGFEPDVHCPTGAPREAFVKVAKAEDGGLGGKGLWRVAKNGLTPGYENDAMKQYLAGQFTKIRKG
jgi:nitrate reductase alpha subunit